MKFDLKINGKRHSVDVPAEMPLLWVLRNEIGLVGTKFGCGGGFCGACTVHIDGAPQRSCLFSVGDVAVSEVTTIEGIGADPVGKRLQDAWLSIDVIQCGYCQAGQIMSAAALLKQIPKPARDDIVSGMNGNICRCATYPRIERAIRIAAGMEEAADAPR